MARILKKYPTFIWVSDEQTLTEKEIAHPYEAGIEFYYAKNCKELEDFLEEEILEDVIVVASYSMAE